MNYHDQNLGKYDIKFSDEVFYILLHCINPHLSNYEELVNIYKDRKDFNTLKVEYKEFYDFIIELLESFDTEKELYLHQKVLELVHYLLKHNYKEIEAKIKVYISNILDVIFVQYHLDIMNFKTNEEIRIYLMKKFNDDKVVNFLMIVLLADTSLTEEYVKSIDMEEFEHLLVNVILLVIYLCKGSTRE